MGGRAANHKPRCHRDVTAGSWKADSKEGRFPVSTRARQGEATEVQGGADLKPRPRFNPAEDVNALEKAITAKEIDEGSIIDILTKRTNEQRQEIKAAYQKQTGKSLEEALKKALSGKLEDVILDMLKTPAQFDASELKAATKVLHSAVVLSIEGLGTNEDTIIEILATRTNQQMKQIKEAYKADYKTDLEKDIVDDTSGDFQKALLALLKGDVTVADPICGPREVRCEMRKVFKGEMFVTPPVVFGDKRLQLD
ncbi:unnamed protein product [Ranitomeya imitator]|uniref:Annexin n=1 Tax=Ranitomeya imitator TaxID=111125 RepID=A0ABN9KZN4_9NEOB|nr:unnamed protein product [Ranitomeya imitator]